MTLTACPFCKATQPARAAAPPKETRCAECKRPYATKLGACPFCAQQGTRATHDRAPAPGESAYRTAGASPIESKTPLATGTASLDDGFPTGLALGVGGSTMILAIVGIARIVGSERLGGGESAGLLGPCLLLGLLFAAFGAAFLEYVRTGHAPWSAIAIDPLGTLLRALVPFVLVPIPAALACFGILDSIDGATARSTEPVVCEVHSVTHQIRKGNDLGWRTGYSCETRNGKTLIGTLTTPVRPEWKAGEKFQVPAAEGILGRWTIRGEAERVVPR